MRKQIMRCLCVLALVATEAPLLWGQGQSQEKPPIYTYVAQWAVPRAQWDEMDKLSERQRAILEKLFANGSIIGYGAFASLVHQEGQPTHGSWFSAMSMANLMKALDGLYNSPDLAVPVLAASKHWDLMLATHTYNSKPGSLRNGYLVGSSFQVKPGREREFRELMRGSLVPIFEKMLADGVINSYSVEGEEVVTEKPGVVTFVYTTADASGMDKFDAGMMAALGKDPAFGAAFDAVIEPGVEHDFLSRIIYMNHK